MYHACHSVGASISSEAVKVLLLARFLLISFAFAQMAPGNIFSTTTDQIPGLLMLHVL